MNKIFPFNPEPKTWFNYSNYLNWTYEQVQGSIEYLNYFNPDYIVLNSPLYAIDTNNLTTPQATKVMEKDPAWECTIFTTNTSGNYLDKNGEEVQDSDDAEKKIVHFYYPSELYFRQGYLNTHPESYICYLPSPDAYSSKTSHTTTMKSNIFNELQKQGKIVKFEPSRIIFSKHWYTQGVQFKGNIDGLNPEHYIMIATGSASWYIQQTTSGGMTFKFLKNAMESSGSIVPFSIEIRPQRYIIDQTENTDHAIWGEGAKEWRLAAGYWEKSQDLTPKAQIFNYNRGLWTDSFPIMHQLYLIEPINGITETNKRWLQQSTDQKVNCEEVIYDEVFASDLINVNNHAASRYKLITKDFDSLDNLGHNIYVIIC